MAIRFLKSLQVLAAVTAGLMAAAPAQSAIQVKIPIAVSSTSPRGQVTEDFAKEVMKATDGRYQVTVYPGGQMYHGAGAVDAISQNIVQMTNEGDNAYPGYSSVADLIEVPFAFKSLESFHAFFDGPAGDVLKKDLKKADLKILTVFDEGPFVVATAKKLIKTPADLKGQIIRSSGHKMVENALHAIGASTVKIPFSEAYSSLQQGIFTGVYTPFNIFIESKLYEVAPHVTLFPSRGAYIWVVNAQWWEDQPEADRKIMSSIAIKLAKKYETDAWADLDKYVSELKAHGGDYYDPTQDKAVAAQFKAAFQPIYAPLEKDTSNPVAEFITKNITSN